MAGGLTTWSAKNYVETVPMWQAVTTKFLNMRFDVVNADTGEIEESRYSWQITRTRRKSYRFIGMTRAAALQCVEAKRAQYARFINPWIFDDATGTWNVMEGLGSVKTVAAVEPVASGGGLYDVEITVEEVVNAFYSGTSLSSDESALSSYVDETMSGSWSYDEEYAA